MSFTQMNTKKIVKIVRNIEPHWVGDGFPVHTFMSYHRDGKQISPFLLLDYAGPTQFQAARYQKGVDQHPHRGFETVTIIYQGEVEHKDNAGHAGKIGPGDVQWMTAARGIIHEEKHSPDFSLQGGLLEMVQLWVNLPAKDKMSPPKYQEILTGHIPIIKVDENGSKIRIIAGHFEQTKGPAQTFTPINLWDLSLKKGSKIDLKNLPDGYNTMILVLKGHVMFNGKEEVQSKELVFFENSNQNICIQSISDSVLLILNGEPIHEPIVGHGPFVMNTKQEIMQAFEDYRLGQF
ncbi:MAG: quercetin 2,3-dioxygenase [Pseudomonadota bacterium]|nr:quercetin 2,3-dioxygenase [Pseudomonadota bacterium]